MIYLKSGLAANNVHHAKIMHWRNKILAAVSNYTFTKAHSEPSNTCTTCKCLHCKYFGHNKWNLPHGIGKSHFDNGVCNIRHNRADYCNYSKWTCTYYRNLSVFSYILISWQTLQSFGCKGPCCQSQLSNYVTTKWL